LNTTVLHVGEKLKVEAVLNPDGKCPAQEFLDEQLESDRQKIKALFFMVALKGNQFRNGEKFKKLDGEIFEFKSYQIRLLCFFHRGGRLIITHGLIKQTDNMRRGEIEKAERIRQQFLAEEVSHG